MRTDPVVLRFVTRRGCALCDEAYGRLLDAARRRPIRVDVVDVDGDSVLLARFGALVPVVLSAEGAVLSSGPLSTADAAAVVRGVTSTGSD